MGGFLECYIIGLEQASSLVTDSDRKFVLAVATSADLEVSQSLSISILGASFDILLLEFCFTTRVLNQLFFLSCCFSCSVCHASRL